MEKPRSEIEALCLSFSTVIEEREGAGTGVSAYDGANIVDYDLVDAVFFPYYIGKDLSIVNAVTVRDVYVLKFGKIGSFLHSFKERRNCRFSSSGLIDADKVPFIVNVQDRLDTQH